MLQQVVQVVSKPTSSIGAEGPDRNEEVGVVPAAVRLGVWSLRNVSSTWPLAGSGGC